jgi:ABC-type nitrate/sulfonate/bicarbonate transport system substrate-binding protein
MVLGLRRLAFAVLACSAFLAGMLAPRSAIAAPGGRLAVDVLVPETRDLQILPFWVALGGGYFARQGLDVHVVSAKAPGLAPGMFKSGAAPAAVLSGPDYERLIADRFPFVLAANLLQNDPFELVMRRADAERMHLTLGMPLRRRLELIRSMSIGVTVADRAHLYALFRSQGLDANTTRIDVMRGEELAGALATSQVDAIYATSPYVEEALVEKDGALLVSGAAGDVPEFSERMIQALALTRAFADTHPVEARGLVHALAEAEHLVRFDRKAATAAVLRALPQLDAKRVSRLVAIYEPAVPATPHVEARLIEREARFYPVGRDRLDLTGIDLDGFVLSTGETFSAGPSGGHSGGSPRLSAAALFGFLALAIALLFAIKDQREGLEDGADVPR